MDSGMDSGSGNVEPDGVPEVKALTFVTMRRFLEQRWSMEQRDRLRARLSKPTLHWLDEGQASEWMAEAHMHEVMRAIYEGELGSDDDAYLDFARELALAGISRFLRIFLSLASERFVLRKIPAVWTRLRRNAGEVEVEVEDELIRLAYRGFPYFGDRVYRLLSLANCQALVMAATQKLPLGHIKGWTEDTLSLEFELRR